MSQRLVAIPQMAQETRMGGLLIATAIEGHPVLPGGIEPTGHLQDTEIGGRPVAAPGVTEVLQVTDPPATAEDQEMMSQMAIALGFTLGSSLMPMAESAKN